MTTNILFYHENYFRENQNTFCVQQLFFENRAVYEIMWKSNIKRGRLLLLCGAPKAGVLQPAGLLYIPHVCSMFPLSPPQHVTTTLEILAAKGGTYWARNVR
jgi:hypothetical protein